MTFHETGHIAQSNTDRPVTVDRPLWQAFKAMQEGIREWCETIDRCQDTYKFATDEKAPEIMKRLRAALALAESVSPRG